MTELIRKEDSLNDGREKLNNAIKAFDQAVVEGDSSVEAAQARVDEKGGVHPTLKARVDDGFTEVNQQLADKANEVEVRKDTYTQPINVSEMDTETKQLFTGGAVAVVGKNAVGAENVKPKAITPDKLSIMQQSENLFDGIYSKLTMGVSGTPATMKFRGLLENEPNKTALIPILPNENYTVKVHEPSKKDVFRVAIINNAPDLSNVNWQSVDKLVTNNDVLNEISFKNTGVGKYLLVYVSSVGLLPKLQVQKGLVASAYAEHLLVPSVHTQQTLPDLIKSKNLFNGDYYKLTLMPQGTPMKLRHRGLLETEKERTAIVPIESGKTYTVSVQGDSNDRFRIAVVNEFPDVFNVDYVDSDITILYDDTRKAHTFTNSVSGKYALVQVSSTGLPIKLQVEEGADVTPYRNHLVLPEEYLGTDILRGSTVLPTSEEIKKNPREAIIIGAQEDESPVVTNCTLSYDKVNYKVGSRGYKMSIGKADTATLTVNPSDAPSIIKGIGVVGLWIYIEDYTKVSNVWVEIFSNADKTQIWSVSSSQSQSIALGGLRNGWNHIRWTASHGNGNSENNLIGWGTIYSTRIMVVTTGATDVTVGKMVGEISEKAQILFVEDAQYKTFHDIAYQDLKERNIPVTWALRISTLGANVGTLNEQLTESDIERLSKENNNSISFHSYDGQNSTMTPTELRIETMKAIKWLSARGYTGWHWRAAFLQNNAPSHAAIRDLVTAYSMPMGGQYVLGSFPFLNPYNTPRISVHGSSPGDFASIFDKLKKTRQLFVCYTHGISGQAGDVTQVEWDNFLVEVDKGISEGWLEGVTFETLNEKFGNYYNIPSNV